MEDDGAAPGDERRGGVPAGQEEAGNEEGMLLPPHEAWRGEEAEGGGRGPRGIGRAPEDLGGGGVGDEGPEEEVRGHRGPLAQSDDVVGPWAAHTAANFRRCCLRGGGEAGAGVGGGQREGEAPGHE